MPKILNFHGLKLDLERAIKRVRLDIKDDWFQDPFKYEDLLNIEYIYRQLEKYNDSKDKYLACQAIHIDIPKPGFTSRYSTEIDIVNRVLLQSVVDIIAEDLDLLHSNRIYSHRLNKERKKEKYFFKYAVEEWRKFTNDTSSELGKNNNSVLLITDLTNFYENIAILDLKDVLDHYNPRGVKEVEYKTCVDTIKNMLFRWCEIHTRKGLPQNRDTSSFLANIFLHPVDDIMQKKDFNYFRYMDDIRIVCKDKFEARSALKKLIQELRKKGLNVNSKKTRILDYNNLVDKKEIDEIYSHTDKKIEQIDAFLKTRLPRNIQVAVPMLREKVIKLIEANNTDREFRYCINRLERIARNEKLAEKINFDLINKKILNELVDKPWSTDTFARYLGSVKIKDDDLSTLKNLLLDKNRNIYEWQSFYLWMLLIRHKHSDPSLIKAARENIEDKANEATTAASCLYLGALGNTNDKMFIAEHYKYFHDHITQRFALIAIKELNYNSIIKPLVQEHIIDCYAGTYTNLLANYKDKFLHEIDPLKEEDIYTELPDDIS